MWVMYNDPHIVISRAFWGELFREGRGEVGHEEVARTWHEAVNKQRVESLGAPLLWAGFVHMGGVELRATRHGRKIKMDTRVH